MQRLAVRQPFYGGNRAPAGPSGEVAARADGQIVYHVADQLNLMGLYYNVQQTPIAKKLLNVTGASRDSTEAWNAHLWEVKR